MAILQTKGKNMSADALSFLLQIMEKRSNSENIAEDTDEEENQESEKNEADHSDEGFATSVCEKKTTN